MSSEAITDLRFFHSYDALGIAGVKAEAQLKAEASAVFSESLTGRSVLDIGAWDGWFSFEAERRGAASVTACDWFCWSGPGWGTRAGFDHVHAQLNSSVKTIECDIPDLNPDLHGRFDTVLLLGVLYHVRDMITVLDQVQALCKDHLILETVTWPGNEPDARYWSDTSLAGDPTNFWTPTTACVTDMLRDLGFKRFTITPTPFRSQRPIIDALRSQVWLLRLLNLFGNRLTSRHIIHAWRD